jgi:hypothetical protein
LSKYLQIAIVARCLSCSLYPPPGRMSQEEIMLLSPRLVQIRPCLGSAYVQFPRRLGTSNINAKFPPSKSIPDQRFCVLLLRNSELSYLSRSGQLFTMPLKRSTDDDASSPDSKRTKLDVEQAARLICLEKTWILAMSCWRRSRGKGLEKDRKPVQTRRRTYCVPWGARRQIRPA